MKVEPIVSVNGNVRGYLVDCVACKIQHYIPIKGMVTWRFNGNLDKPTFTPSLMVNRDLSNPTSPRCHSFIRDGKWEYLSDCTHDLAGQTVDMTEVE